MTAKSNIILRRLAMAAVSGALLASVSGAGAIAQTVSYTYDALGRLSTVTYPNGVIVTYTYDAANNRTARTSTAPVSGKWGSFNWGAAAWG